MNWAEHLELLEEAVSEVDRTNIVGATRWEPPGNIADMMCMSEAIVSEVWESQESADDVSLSSFDERPDWMKERIE